MAKLDRYIGTQVFFAILAVLGIILGLALLFAFIDELSDLNKGDYGLGQVLWYVLLTAPRRAYEMLPMAALIGCLIGLGTLASNSELTIMRAAGVSIGRIVWAVMKPMLVLMLAGILIGEYVAPLTENQAQADRALAQGGGAAQSSKRGMWHRQGQEYVHINAVQPNGILLGVTRYRFDDERRLLSASFARRAEYRDSHWMLRNVQTTVLHEDRSEVINQPEERWDIELNPELLGTVVMEPEALSVTGLWQYIHYLGEQGLNNARYWLAFWIKVLQPLVTGALVLMAISFIFGPLRSVSMGARMLMGIMTGFAVYVSDRVFGPVSLVYAVPPILAAIAPSLLFGGISFYILSRKQ